MELFYKITSGSLDEVLAEQSAMMQDVLGCVPLPGSHLQPHAVPYISEPQTVGADDLAASFDAVIAAPAVAFSDKALEVTCGDAAKAKKVKVQP